MKVLICSNNNEFASVLTHRLKNEEHEVYLLTGQSESKDTNNSKVFQKYDFEYTDENVAKIMNNISVDTLIVAGYMDFMFQELSIGKKAVEYISGMTNVILAAKAAGIKRVVYCSSLKVFEENPEPFIDSNMKPAFRSVYAGALAQVESFFASCREKDEFEIQIIRYPEIFGNYSKDKYSLDICDKMIVDYINRGSISYNPEVTHMLLNVKDAVQILVNVLNRKTTKDMYLIDAEVCSEEEIANEITRVSKAKKEGVLKIDKTGSRQLFSTKVIDSDNESLTFSPRHNVKNDILEIYKRIKKVELTKEKNKNKFSLQKVLRSIIETTIFFLVASVIEYFVLKYQLTIGIDFYLLFAVIIAVVYGIGCAMYGIILTTIGKLVLAVTVASSFSSLADYELYTQILQVMICGVIVGLMQDSFRVKNNNLKEVNNYNLQQLNDLMRINENNVYIKEMYEKRIAAYGNNLAKLYNTISQLSFLDVRKVIFQTAKVVSEYIETDHVAIFVSGNKSVFYRLAASTSEKGRILGKSIVFDENAYYYDELSNREVYMNRTFDAKQPTYISAVYGDEGNVEAIIMIWAMGLEQVNLYQSSLISILSRLVERTMSNALQYEDVYFENSFIENRRVMKMDSFIERLQVFESGVEMGVISYALIKVEIPVGMTIEECFSKVENLLRDTDHIGSNMREIYVILPNSNEEDVVFVKDRFSKNSLETNMVTKEDVLRGENEELMDITTY